MRLKSTGFTLIELMIVVAVIAILAVIAVPLFTEQVKKSRRAEGVAESGRMQIDLERWRAEHPSYADTATPSATYPKVSTTVKGYSFVLSGQTGTTYTLTGTRQGPQSGDRCGELVTTPPPGKPTWATASCN